MSSVNVITSWLVPAGQKPTALFVLAARMWSAKVQTDAEAGDKCADANSAPTIAMSKALLIKL